jgi:hypothetical protein
MEHASISAAKGYEAEHEFLQRYLATEETKAAAFTEYANVRRAQ